MKVAVIYSGEPRTYHKVVDQHIEFFEGLTVDTFHSTWMHLEDREKAKIKLAPRLTNFNEVDYLCHDRPDLLKFEKLLLNNKQNHPIFMLGRIQHMTAMAFMPLYYSKQEYDFVVRLRYDFTYDGKLKDFLQNVGSRDLLVTRKMGGKSSPINIWDGFAAGTPNVMSWYFDFNKWLPFSLFDSQVAGWKFQPEFVYGTYVRLCQLNVVDCGVQPHHVYPDNKDVEWHRTERTVQYYRDLARFHPEFYKQRNGKLIIENDSPTVTDELIINRLAEEGVTCGEV
jgi:hypothetical protein